MPKLSVIIPIYNAEQYLASCMDSLITQTFQQYEVLLVDDGSTDDSGNICKEYAAKDKRFHYLHQENKGVSNARNTGLSYASGEWISFIDADDILPSTAFEILLEQTNDDIDLVMGSYIVRKADGTEQQEIRQFLHIWDSIKGINLLFQTKEYGYQGYLWNKLFKSKIITDAKIKFDETFHFNEDRLFCAQYICSMKGKLLFTSQPVYIYIQRPTSVMGQAYKQFNPHIVDDYESSLLILHLLQKRGFPVSSINLARDRIIDSYDLIRHNMRTTGYNKAKTAIATLRKRAIHDVGGWKYFTRNRIRRFFSRLFSHLQKSR